ncbi:MAG TPA: type VII secretion system-associated protein [Streptomyces sp.]|uniref:type VII secretion system-associated protein n=1 Tax=Streptomyces sp. TaxID=1931 RepID=UPI002B77F1D8|nr:type VII secretion system-associated protein [Streptomyces sp.]HWU09008.1 type VII secretion system-associated protein [Streptomyces sp.]
MPTSEGPPDAVRGPVPAPGAAPADVSPRPPAPVGRDQQHFPVPPGDIVAAARTAPDHWLSVTDRHWLGETDDEPAPPWAVLGRWRSDTHGEIVEWEANPDYRPSPAALGWAPPVTDADAAVHLAATGYGPDADVTEALAKAGAVAVCVAENGEPAWTRAPGGALTVPVFPVSPRASADRLPAHVTMALPDLLDRLPPGRDVMFLSASAPAALLVPGEDLRARWAETSGAPARSGEHPRTDPGTPSKRGQDE